jgi:hypothetical protein
MHSRGVGCEAGFHDVHLAMLISCASSNCRIVTKAAPCRHGIMGRGEMSDQRRESAAPVEPYFDRTPRLFGDGLPESLVYDASPRMLHLQAGMRGGERLLPQGWADYTLAPTHIGTSYAACFRANTDRLFPTSRPTPPGHRAPPTSASSSYAATA